MAAPQGIRMGRIRFMYAYPIAGAGLSGLGMLLAPGLVQKTFGMGSQDPVFFGIAASAWLAFGLLSILGLREPLRFLPVLCMQLTYKTAWVLGAVVPAAVTGRLPGYAGFVVVIMLSYIVGDLIAIPFGYVFARREPA